MRKYILFFLILLLPIYGKVTLQVLGSGGPEMHDKRASTAYIIWVDNKAKILVDFGSGASLRFEQTKAKIEDIELILLTHLHVDHTADLPGLLKASFFTKASGSVEVFGPEGNHIMPSAKKFMQRLFKNNKGAWEYLGDHLDGSASLQLNTHTIDETKKVTRIYHKGNISVDAITVHHGPIPALAYKVTIHKKSITFSGDMSGKLHTLPLLATNTNLLVAHNAIAEHTQGVATNLHMKPSTIGKIAKRSKAKKLLLSHRMKRSLGHEKETLKEIRKHYKNSVKFANDLDTVVVK